jgi:hypothetical protein
VSSVSTNKAKYEIHAATSFLFLFYKRNALTTNSYFFLDLDMEHHAVMKTKDWENQSTVNYSFLVPLFPHYLMLHVSPSSI